ncbi:hypothetical protein LSAT2_004395 [Lamellibrachia satsuma]|nr:hypothetical protein LSAT2_004395 [Lamellibrachia satsuma]
MRAIIVLLLVFLTLALVATYPTDEEEAEELRLLLDEISEMTSVNGGRVKRANNFNMRVPKPPEGAVFLLPKRPRSEGKCWCFYWGFGKCWRTRYGCKCVGPSSKFNGCLVSVYNKHEHWCQAGSKGGSCYCIDLPSKLAVTCMSNTRTKFG